MNRNCYRYAGIGLLVISFFFETAGLLFCEDAENKDGEIPAAVSAEDSILPTLQPLSDEKPAPAVSASSARKKDIVPIEIGDRLRVKIFPEDPYIKGGEMEVSSEGNITLPLVGKVMVKNLTSIEAEREIAKILDADYLVNPEVVIEMAERSKTTAKTVIVFGQVRKPGPYEFPPDKKQMTLLEVISLAGGFSEIANIKKIKIVRKSENDQSVINANGEAIMSGNDPDIELEPGDVVTVSESLF